MRERGQNPVPTLTGAPGSGKTTVARLLAAASQRAVHIECDQFFHFIQSGYVEPWKPDPRQQNRDSERLPDAAALGRLRDEFADLGALWAYVVDSGTVPPEEIASVLSETL